MQTMATTITMTVKSLLINQGDSFTLQELELLLNDFLLSSIYFPTYSAEGELNQKKYDFQLIAEKRNLKLESLKLEELKTITND